MIGAGFGGLAAAIVLAARGRRVRVLEAGDAAGGKAGTATVDGVTFDTGPSVLTLPDVFDALFREGGGALSDAVTLRTPTPAFRYSWADGAKLDLAPDLAGSLAAVRASFGAAAEREFAAYLGDARRIWERGGERFVRGPAPGLHMLRSPADLLALTAVDPLRTLSVAIDARVTEPHLRMLLRRYATYNGSDPRRTPATLGCIAHVELALGGHGVEGGIAALVRALVALAERLGVVFEYGRAARKITVRGGRAVAIETDNGSLAVDAVVANADAAVVLGGLAPGKPPTGERSTSGWTCVVRAARVARAAHSVVFPANYAAEFTDLFDRGHPPGDPTVYACAQGAAHGLAGWDDAEPIFLMANAPAETAPTAPETWSALRRKVLARAADAGIISVGDRVVWERTATDLAARFPGTGGAIYGLASHGPWSAFKRPASRSGTRGLYLASGSAHPGGGMPLCALSGRLAAEALLEDII